MQNFRYSEQNVMKYAFWQNRNVTVYAPCQASLHLTNECFQQHDRKNYQKIFGE